MVQWSGQTTGFLFIKLWLVFFTDKYILKNYCRTIIMKILNFDYQIYIIVIFLVCFKVANLGCIYFSLVLSSQIDNQVNSNDCLYFFVLLFGQFRSSGYLSMM